MTCDIVSRMDVTMTSCARWGRALLSGVLFRFGQNLASSEIRNREPRDA